MTTCRNPNLLIGKAIYENLTDGELGLETCPHCAGAGCYTDPADEERYCQGSGYKSGCNCPDCKPGWRGMT
jgi:hypothetical protein